MVFLKEFLEISDFEKNSADDKKYCKGHVSSDNVLTFCLLAANFVIC